MEDSKKNKERKVLTDEELEQVSGGRVVFWIESGCSYPHNDTKEKCESQHSQCAWSEKLKKCFEDRQLMIYAEAKASASGAS